MTKEEFWEKWQPADHPPIVPTNETKLEFMEDLDAVFQQLHDDEYCFECEECGGSVSAY